MASGAPAAVPEEPSASAPAAAAASSSADLPQPLPPAARNEGSEASKGEQALAVKKEMTKSSISGRVIIKPGKYNT